MSIVTKKLGNWGEKLAVVFLQKNNYSILSRNYHCRYGEIDIVAMDKNGFIVFVEVKTRSSKNFGLGMEAINYTKIQRIKKTAIIYLSERSPKHHGLRFDIIDINLEDAENPEILHIKNAF